MSSRSPYRRTIFVMGLIIACIAIFTRCIRERPANSPGYTADKPSRDGAFAPDRYLSRF